MTEAQIAHNARNAAAKAARQKRKIDAYLSHVGRNNDRAEISASAREMKARIQREVERYREKEAVSQQTPLPLAA